MLQTLKSIECFDIDFLKFSFCITDYNIYNGKININSKMIYYLLL